MAKTQVKIQTKTEVRNTAAKADKILRGIDNDMVSIQKDQSKITDRLKGVVSSTILVRNMLSGISNTVLTAPTEAPVKSAKAITAKPVKVTKPVSKAVAAPKKKPAIKSAKNLEAVRPPMKQILQDILSNASNGRATQADLFKEACRLHGKFARQSVKAALKDSKLFTKIGNEYESATQDKIVVLSTTSDDEAENFLESVNNQQSTAHVS